jgi:hypothetical protein
MHLMHFMYFMRLWISVIQEEFVEFSLIKGKYVSMYAHNKLSFKVRPYRVENAWYFFRPPPYGGLLLTAVAYNAFYLCSMWLVQRRHFRGEGGSRPPYNASFLSVSVKTRLEHFHRAR